jgi:sodium/proline symporter
MSAVGLYFYKKTDNLSDYILGGRNLNPWVSAISAQASDMSGWLLMGLPGYAYVAGLEASWISVGLALGTYLNWKYTAKRLRIFSQRTDDAITLSSYFQKRFRTNSISLRLLTSFFILFFFTIYTSSGLVASGKLFNSIFSVDYIWALGIGLTTVVLYTFLGGFMAVSWTDLFQGMLMFFALLIVPFVLLGKTGGITNTIDIINTIDPKLLTFSIGSIGLMSIISNAAWGLGYFGQPHILARFMAVRNPDEIKYSRLISMVWVMISLAAAVIIGILGRAYYMNTPDFSSETVFLKASAELFPPLISGVLLSAVLAAIMSTADSQLLVASSAFVEDIYNVLSKKVLDQKKQVWMGRFIVLGIAIIAFILGINPENTVLGMVSYAWAGLGGTFGPAVLFSLYYSKTTYKGMFYGILSGGLTVIIWKNFLNGGIFELYEIVPAFLVSSMMIFIISNIDKNNQDVDYFKELLK